MSYYGWAWVGIGRYWWVWSGYGYKFEGKCWALVCMHLKVYATRGWGKELTHVLASTLVIGASHVARSLIEFHCVVNLLVVEPWARLLLAITHCEFHFMMSLLFAPTLCHRLVISLSLHNLKATSNYYTLDDILLSKEMTSFCLWIFLHFLSHVRHVDISQDLYERHSCRKMEEKNPTQITHYSWKISVPKFSSYIWPTPGTTLKTSNVKPNKKNPTSLEYEVLYMLFWYTW